MESSKETGDLDTQSMGSAAPSDVSKGKKGKGANSKSSDLEKELKREKKFKKLLKEALEEEKEKVVGQSSGEKIVKLLMACSKNFIPV